MTAVEHIDFQRHDIELLRAVAPKLTLEETALLLRELRWAEAADVPSNAQRLLLTIFDKKGAANEDQDQS